MRPYHRPLIVVFSSFALATLLSYAAVELTEPSKEPSSGSSAKPPAIRLNCEVEEVVGIALPDNWADKGDCGLRIVASSTPPRRSIPADRTPLSPEESKLLVQKTEFQEIVVKVEAGDAEAMFHRATGHLVGLGTPIDRPAGAKWLRLAAEKGHVQAQFSYGKVCLLGEIRPKDVKEAIRWFRLAAEKANPDAELSLAQAYANGEGVEADEKEALRWLKLSATHGHPIAQSDYAFAILDEDDPDLCGESAEWLRKSALQGKSSAMFNLAIMYQRGVGVPKDRITAFAWYMVSAMDGNEGIREEVAKVLANATASERRKAIDRTKGIIAKLNVAPMFSLGSHSIELTNQFHRQFELAQLGDAEDQFALARLYHEGIGTVKDPFEAAVWCRKAAEQGNIDAMRTLAICLENGDGVKEDFDEMAKWYRKAAEKDDPESQFKLGVCYREGTGVVKDEKQAVTWTKKAAEHGHPIAQANLGSFILSTIDEASLPEAIKWFKLSAKQGHTGGMYKYGMALYAGMGATADRIEGAAWLILCLPRIAKQDLKEHIKVTLDKLTPEERTKAEAAATEIKKTL
jgi:TPR repeat protein